MASAAYLVRDGGLPGENITIYEESDAVGGSLDAEDIKAGHGYLMRGYRMLESKVYSCLFDLMSFIPSLNDPDMSVMDEFKAFNDQIDIKATSRLVKDGKVVDPFPFDLRLKDRFRLLWLLTRPEGDLKDMAIEDYFSASFFTGTFWLQFCTTFSFQPWHSLVELKRYILRFYHVSPQLSSMACVRLTPFNERESIVLPLEAWLRDQGVRFDFNVQVLDLEFAEVDGVKSVKKLYCMKGRAPFFVEVFERDLVFATLGSMTANSSTGAMDRAPCPNLASKNSSWLLWENIAGKTSTLGRPAVFNSDIEKSKWTSFSMTFTDSCFVDELTRLTGKETGMEGAVTIKDSNWLLSFAMTPYPFFAGQPEHVSVGWGYGLYPERKGNYIQKKMTECTGREMLIELCSHLGMQSHIDRIVQTTTCIPCLMPFITSQFMPRTATDRPRVVTKEISNLAVLGQFCEIPDDIVFTLEYSVRAAQIGVYSLLNLRRKVTSIYKGYRAPWHVYGAVRTVMQPTTLEGGNNQGFLRAAMVLIALTGGFYAIALNLL